MAEKERSEYSDMMRRIPAERERGAENKTRKTINQQNSQMAFLIKEPNSEKALRLYERQRRTI